MRSGVVVAGGRSTRFGDVDKAVSDLAGTPMIRRVVDRIGPVVDEVVVNCRVDQRAAIEDALEGLDRPASIAIDQEPDLGPMAGIATGLRAAEGEYALVVACDMPFVDPSLVNVLFERAASHDAAGHDAASHDAVGHDAAIPRPDEWFQTTQAVYRAEAMAAACERALDAGERRVVAALEDIEYVVLDREDVEDHASMATFENLNTRAEFDAAADRF